jgi:CheY-like chemotaxis protein
LEYLEKAREGENEYPFPDLIFLDINMPKINGFEFLKKAKEKKLITKDKPLIVVMLTSSLNPDDQTTAELTFPDEIKEYKNKPLTEEMLKEIIEKYF